MKKLNLSSVRKIYKLGWCINNMNLEMSFGYGKGNGVVASSVKFKGVLH